jgi:hypothetical protein
MAGPGDGGEDGVWFVCHQITGWRVWGAAAGFGLLGSACFSVDGFGMLLGAAVPEAPAGSGSRMPEANLHTIRSTGSELG